MQLYPKLYIEVLQIAKKQFNANIGEREFLLEEKLAGGGTPTPPVTQETSPTKRRVNV